MVKRLILAALLAVSCGRLEIQNILFPLVPDVNDRVEASFKWNENHPPVTLSAPADYRFYAGSDIHIVDERPVFFERMTSTCAEDPAAAFYLCLGDLLFGKEHMDWIADIMASSTAPGFILVGNHDLLFGLWDTWKATFHSSTYYFFVDTPAGKDLYIMLDSASGTLGEKQAKWLEGVLADVRPSCRHCVVSVHTNIFRTDATQFPSTNFTREETWFLLDLMTRSKVDMMIAGHDHVRDVSFFNGVTYITLDSLKDDSPSASYMTVDVGDGLEYKFVEFN